jgi:hypothetical protein
MAGRRTRQVEVVRLSMKVQQMTMQRSIAIAEMESEDMMMKTPWLGNGEGERLIWKFLTSAHCN